MKLRFVNTPRGNYHMTELLQAICSAAQADGHDAAIEARFPPLDVDTVCVVIPHEFYGCEPAERWPTREQRARSIALFVENPFTVWFENACELAPHFASVMAINHGSVVELRRRGVWVEHLQIGYVPDWDAWQGRDVERPIDVTYLGAADQRRDAYLAGYGRWFWQHRTAMLVPVIAPKPRSRPDYLVNAEKFLHLTRSKVLLNLHRSGSWSFEWVRAVQAMANGCVVVSEPSVDHGPLVPGEHFIAASAGSIPHVANRLLDNPSRLEAIRGAAYELIRDELPISATVEQLMAKADDVISGRSSHQLATGDPVERVRSAGGGGPAPPDRETRLAASVRNLTTEVMELRRSISRLVERADGRDDSAEPELVIRTATFADARPTVTVSITLFNYEREVVAALASVAASEFEDYEVLVIDDGSSDASIDAVRAFALEHPWMPLALLRHRVNRGLGASRNALSRNARGEMMFVLDADNEIYPTTLGRLVEALEADPGASFAYPLLGVTCADQPTELLSQHAWDPDGFRSGNYIDAMALIRLDDLIALGGYTEDPRLTGWEDFHLWCRCAESGRRGRHVPEVLARYRKAEHSMLAWTQTDASLAWSIMHARFPALFDTVPAQ